MVMGDEPHYGSRDCRDRHRRGVGGVRGLVVATTPRGISADYRHTA